MAEKQYQVGEFYVNETTDDEYQVGEVYVNEDGAAAPPGGLSIIIAMYHRLRQMGV